MSTKNERAAGGWFCSLKAWDIHCDVCEAIIESGALYHGNSPYGRSRPFSVRISKYRDDFIHVCDKHSDASIEKFIQKIQESKI